MSSLTLISGEEDFLAERAAHEAAHASLCDETFQYYLPDGLNAYLQESQSPLISGGSRAYILWGAKEVPPLPDSPQDAVIVVSGKKSLQDSRAKRSFTFPKLKSYADNNEVVKWILKEGSFFNIDLSRVAGALFVNSGSCLRKLAREIEKLAAAVPEGSVVAPEEARSLMCFSAELTPREIIDAICDGYTVKALAFYDRMQERTDETGWIIAYMQRHVLQQLKLEVILKEKVSDERSAELLGVHPFIFKKILTSRRSLWTEESLMASLEFLCDMDIAHKRGEEFARFSLESEIIRLSEEARDVKRY